MANEPRTFVCGWGKRLPGFPTAVPNGVVCVALRGYASRRPDCHRGALWPR